MFAPDQLHDTIVKTLATQAIEIPPGKKAALVTSWNGPGTPIQAALVARVNDKWTVGSQVEWKGGQPSIGVQVHAIF